MQQAVAAATHVGRVRDRNEDHAVVGDRVVSGPQDAYVETSTGPPLLVGALDGMGGHPAGDLASGIAAQVLARSAPPATDEQVDEIVAAMQQAVHEHMQSDPSTTAMGTTLVLASLLEPHRALVAAVGDSTALWFAEDELQSLVSADRSFGGLITQCIGGTRSRERVQPHVVEVTGPGRLLLCTDGLTDVLDDGELVTALRDGATPRDAAVDLVDRAVLGGGPDNVTVVVADLVNGR